MNNKFKHYDLPAIEESLRITRITDNLIERLSRDRKGIIFKKHLLATSRIVYDQSKMQWQVIVLKNGGSFYTKSECEIVAYLNMLLSNGTLEWMGENNG